MIVPVIMLAPEQEAVLASGADRVMIQRPHAESLLSSIRGATSLSYA